MPTQTQNKTQPTSASVEEFINKIEDPEQREDARLLCRLMGKITGQPAVMWGASIVGFGTYHYKYQSGREGDAGAIGFSARKSMLTIYLADGVDKYSEQLSELGPYKTGKVCLYIKRLSDIDMKVLQAIITASYNYVMVHKHDMHRAE